MAEPFLDRIREATVDPSLLPLDELNSAAASLSANISPERGISMLRAAYGHLKDDAAAEDLRQRLNAEVELVADDQRQLLAVLCAEALIILFSRANGGLGLIPALAVRCAAHRRWQPVHPDLESHAESYLAQRAVFVRRRKPPGFRVETESGDDQLAQFKAGFENLRGVVQDDRDKTWERDQLSWFLLSQTRPAGSLALAREFDNCLLFLPEPLAAEEMLGGVLRKPTGESQPLAPLALSGNLLDLCPDLSVEDRPESIKPERQDDEAKTVRRYLDQIYLNRAFLNARTKR